MSIPNGARRLAGVVAALAAAGAVFAPASEIAKWALFRWAVTAWDSAENPMIAGFGKSVGLARDELGSMSASAIVAAAALGVLATVPIVIGLLCVRRTLRECAAGRPFSELSVRNFRWFAWASLWAMIAGWVEPQVAHTVVTVLSPDLQNEISIGVGVSSTGLTQIFAVLFLITVTHMFAEAKRMAEDVEGLL
jgi:hypothetical protein